MRERQVTPRRWMVALLFSGTACLHVVNPNVIGPQGEHLMELQCWCSQGKGE